LELVLPPLQCTSNSTLKLSNVTACHLSGLHLWAQPFLGLWNWHVGRRFREISFSPYTV